MSVCFCQSVLSLVWSFTEWGEWWWVSLNLGPRASGQGAKIRVRNGYDDWKRRYVSNINCSISLSLSFDTIPSPYGILTHFLRFCTSLRLSGSVLFSLALSGFALPPSSVLFISPLFPLPSSPTSGRLAGMQTLLEQKTRQMELVQAEYDDFVASSKGLVH